MVKSKQYSTILPERERWDRKLEYLLSMLGWLVGLGNLWRFPYVCMRNGGGAFLIPYIICLLFCGLPLFFLETAVGQFTGKGFMHVWEVCPLFKGIGVGMLVSCLVCNVYYNMIIAWTIYYIGNSFISPLPWTTCNNEWNSPCCAEERTNFDFNANITLFSNNISVSNGQNYTTPVADFENKTCKRITAQEDFWQENALQLSNGIDEIGNVNWQMMLCLFGAWLIVGICIIKGVKSVGKVVYVTATLPYVLLTIILVRGLTLDGSINGVMLYLRPDFSKLLVLQVWIEAAVQVFYSLGPGWGPLYSMASFNKFDNNCLRDSVILSLCGEGTSIYAGLGIFTVLGYMAAKLNIPLHTIVKSGPGLGFIAYPEALSQLPGQNFWSCLFFVMLFTVGLDSMFVNTEATLGAIMDGFQGLRQRRVQLMFIYCLLNFLVGIIFCTEGGMYIFQLIDWYIAVFAIPMFAFLECIVFAWIYGTDRLSQDVKLMLKRDIPLYHKVCLRFITPLILFGLLIASFIGYKPVTYGSYHYPDYVIGIGVVISVIPLFPVVVCGILAIINSNKRSFNDKIRDALKPTLKWRPIYKDQTEELSCNYKDFNTETKM